MFPNELKLGIVGNGFVGKATQMLRSKKVEIITYDLDPNLCQPPGTSLTDISQCDIAMISVPTPMNPDLSVHTDIVIDTIQAIKDTPNSRCFIVVRSTVPPGTCQRHGVYFMPEFLTEKNYLNDFYHTSPWIFGVEQTECTKIFQAYITLVLETAYTEGNIKSCQIEWMDTSEAEMVKYFRNTFLATKVAFCNEIEAFCHQKGINYDRVRKIACQDCRIGISHSQVPGPDGKRGFGGTCFPKDCHGLKHEIIQHGQTPFILDSVIQRNESIDRSEKDWMKDKGRTNV